MRLNRLSPIWRGPNPSSPKRRSTWKRRKRENYQTRALRTLRLTLRNVQYPAIVQLTTKIGEVKYEKIISSNENIDFKHVIPNKYYVRVIFDKNKNGKYDPGNYLNKSFAERVSHLDEELDIRAGWDLVQEFILK